MYRVLLEFCLGGSLLFEGGTFIQLNSGFGAIFVGRHLENFHFPLLLKMTRIEINVLFNEVLSIVLSFMVLAP